MSIIIPFKPRLNQSNENAPSGDPVLLKKLIFRGTLSGLMARMIAEQVFCNSTGQEVVARYVFSLPPQSAVIGCVMRVGDRIIKAELKEKISARQEYEKSLKSGHLTTLLEQEEDNLFVMNIGNLKSGEELHCSLMYDQSVDWQGAGLRFLIPFTHAPRCIVAKTLEELDLAMRTVSPVRQIVPYSVDLVLEIEPGFTFTLSSPSHPDGFSLLKGRPYDAHKISLESLKPDRDFVLSLEMTKSEIQTVACIGSNGQERFVGLTVFPDIHQAKDSVAKPTDIMLVLDYSGSMLGAKEQGLRVLVSKLLRLIAEDSNSLPKGFSHRVGIIIFNEKPTMVVPLAVASTVDMRVLKNHTPDGGTHAGLALDYATALLREVRGDVNARSSHIVFISDGATTDHPKTLSTDIPIVSVGIDSAVNQEYIKVLAQKTGGVDYYVYPGEDYEWLTNLLHGALSGAVLRDLAVTKISADGTQTNCFNVCGFPHVYYGRPAQLFLQCEFSCIEGAEDRFVVSGKLPDGSDFSSHVNLASAITSDSLPNLWAREKLRVMEVKLANLREAQIGFDPVFSAMFLMNSMTPDQFEQVILDHCLKYGLLSKKTSFVGVEESAIPDYADASVEPKTNIVIHDVAVMPPHLWDFSPSVIGGGSNRRAEPQFRRSVGIQGFGRLATINETQAFVNAAKTASFTQDQDDDSVVTLLNGLDKYVLYLTQEMGESDFEAVYNRFIGKLGNMVPFFTESDRARCAYLFQCVATHFNKHDAVVTRFADIFVAPTNCDRKAIEWWQRYLSIRNG